MYGQAVVIDGGAAQPSTWESATQVERRTRYASAGCGAAMTMTAFGCAATVLRRPGSSRAARAPSPVMAAATRHAICRPFMNEALISVMSWWLAGGAAWLAVANAAP